MSECVAGARAFSHCCGPLAGEPMPCRPGKASTCGVNWTLRVHADGIQRCSSEKGMHFNHPVCLAGAQWRGVVACVGSSSQGIRLDPSGTVLGGKEHAGWEGGKTVLEHSHLHAVK